MRFITLTAGLILLASTVAAAPPGRALTVGITVNCPYGLGSWYQGVRETLLRLDGVHTVSEKASAETWTCEVRFRDDRVPDLLAFERYLEESGNGATLRGVEATFEGWLKEEEGDLWLLRPEGERLRLAPLARKVQWDPKPGRERPMTPGERDAYARLRSGWRSASAAAEVTGPLRPGGPGEAYVLEVRAFRWR
jgi:galactose oxidase